MSAYLAHQRNRPYLDFANLWLFADQYGLSVNGFGAGPAETIAPTVIADIFFLHDRGKYNTLYFVVYFGSLMVRPSLSKLHQNDSRI